MRNEDCLLGGSRPRELNHASAILPAVCQTSNKITSLKNAYMKIQFYYNQMG